MRRLQSGGGEDDEAVRIRAAARDPALLEWLYGRHSAAVYGYLRRVLPDEQAAEDILQEVFLQLWRTLPAYDPEQGPLRPWLMAMARSRAVDHLRRYRAEAGRWGDVAEAAGLEPVAPEGVGDEHHVTRAALRQAIRRLPVEQRRALYAVYYRGLSHKDAALRLLVPLGTLKGRLRLSLRHLRRLFDGSSREG